MSTPADRLEADLAACAGGSIVLVTGAGVSRASGLATFRGSDPGAVWRRDDVDKATRGFFERRPVEQWQWYLGRFGSLDRARPNAAHRAIARLERWQTGRDGDFLLVTQNIDTLHEQAGSQRLVKVHGSSDRLRCAAEGCSLGAPSGSLPRDPGLFDRFLEDPRETHLPRCPRCDSLLRAHVLFFDEHYQEHVDYRFDEAMRGFAGADLVLFVGTSFSVGITDLALRQALGRRVPTYSIDPGAAGPPARGVVAIAEAAEELLPRMAGRLAAAREAETD